MNRRGATLKWATLAVVFAAGNVAARTNAAAPPEAPALPPVTVQLSLKDSGPDIPWELKLENTSSTRLQIVDDAKLLWFEVRLPGQKKSRICKLPDDLFPKSGTPKTTKELGPSESIVRRVDGRFYCFDPGKQKTLVPTASVTPHYGWPSRTKTKWAHGQRVEAPLPDQEPFVAEPADASANTLGPAKNFAGDPVILDERYAAWSSGLGEDAPNDDDEDQPALEMVRGSDARDEMAAIATVRVRNPGKSRVTMFVRRELLTFEVLTPRGTMTCASEPDARNPDRRAYTTLGPHGSLSLISRLVEFCPRGTFAVPGLYLVKATLDADADGSDFGLNAFTGSLTTGKPIPVRIHRAIRIVPNHRLLTPGGYGGAQPGQAAPPSSPAPAAAPPPDVPPPPPPPADMPAPPS